MHFRKLMFYFNPSEGIYEKGGAHLCFAFFTFRVARKIYHGGTEFTENHGDFLLFLCVSQRSQFLRIYHGGTEFTENHGDFLLFLCVSQRLQILRIYHGGTEFTENHGDFLLFLCVSQ